jgi:hypothetical protein
MRTIPTQWVYMLAHAKYHDVPLGATVMHESSVVGCNFAHNCISSPIGWVLLGFPSEWHPASSEVM